MGGLTLDVEENQLMIRTCNDWWLMMVDLFKAKSMAQDGCRYCFFWPFFFRSRDLQMKWSFLAASHPILQNPILTHARYLQPLVSAAVFDNLTLDNLILGGEAPFTWVRWLISRRMKAYSSSTIDCAMVSSLNDTPLPCCEHIRSICWFSSQWSYGWGEDPGM